MMLMTAKTIHAHLYMVPLCLQNVNKTEFMVFIMNT